MTGARWLRWSLIEALLAVACSWAVASADVGEEGEPERQIIWSGTLTVGYADDDQRMVTHLRVGGQIYGYNVLSDGYGQLSPTHFDWRGQSVRVSLLGMLIDQEGASSVHVMLSHELPDYYELQIGERSFRLVDATHPPPLPGTPTSGTTSVSTGARVRRSRPASVSLPLKHRKA